MWITITETQFLEQCTGPETSALKTAALAVGQPEPLTAIIAKVVQEVRGYVAACSQNSLGDGITIPQELEADAIAIIRYRAFNRLPVKSLLTETRVEEYRDAISKMKDVARCNFRVEQPTTVSTQVISGPAVKLVSSTKRKATRDSMRGL